MTRETATIVVIGILAIRLKSFNAEASTIASAVAILAEENGGEDWEARVICARNMPWQLPDFDLERILQNMSRIHHCALGQCRLRILQMPRSLIACVAAWQRHVHKTHSRAGFQAGPSLSRP